MYIKILLNFCAFLWYNFSMKKNKEFKKRINLSVPLKYVSNLVLSQYSLGEFVSNRTIYLGYGDFSFALTTTTGKYLVKIIKSINSENFRI